MCAVGGTLDTNVTYRRDKKLFAGDWVWCSVDVWEESTVCVWEEEGGGKM
jgi:hypothetical protein